jgi:hypothetical protein
MTVEFCDGCHQLPEEFETDHGKFHWVVLDKDGSPTHLTDDLEDKFLCIDIKNPERIKDREYYCINCIDRMGFEKID